MTIQDHKNQLIEAVEKGKLLANEAFKIYEEILEKACQNNGRIPL